VRPALSTSTSSNRPRAVFASSEYPSADTPARLPSPAGAAALDYPACVSGPSSAPAGGEDASSARHRGGGTRSQRAVFALYFLVTCFALLEGFARLREEPRVTAFVPSANPKLVYELDPNLDGINARGFRGEAFDTSSSDETFLVAVLGDSHTLGVEVPRDQFTFPRQLESRLETLTPELGARVLNFGVSGYNTAQELELFESVVLPLSPDLVILQYTINDSHICNFLKPAHPRLNWLIHRSAFLVWALERLLYSQFGREHLFDRVGRIAPDLLIYTEGLVGTLRIESDEDPLRAGHPPRSPERVPERYHYMLGRENLERHLQRFGEIARAEGILLVGTGMIAQDDRSIFEEAGFEVYSFYDAFEGFDLLRDGGYDPADTSDHFDERGNLILGRRLAEFVHERILGRNGAAPDAP